MNAIVKRIWSALDGCLVFDFTINREPNDGFPTTVKVRCKSTADEQTLVINETRPTSFDLKFRSGCRVRGYLQLRYQVHIEGVHCTAIFADIWFGVTGQYGDTHFEGLMVAWPSRPGPVPLPPTPIPPAEPDYPTQPGSPMPVITSAPDELFPYVYVRRSPAVPSEDMQYGFIQYSIGSPPAGDFITALAAAHAQGRDAEQGLALSFIAGASPYQGQFVSRMRDLSGPLRDFPAVALRLRAQTVLSKAWLDRLAVDLDILLARYNDDAGYFQSADYLAGVDRVWQSYFALVVTLGYDQALLDAFTLSLWLAHLIGLAVAPNATGPVTLNELAPGQIAMLAHATIVMPASAFPLPHATQLSPPATRHGEAGWIEPYAIGDLQLVRQRLVRYAAGEIARIENVMRGERKEITSRRTRRQLAYQEQSGAEEQLLQNDGGDERTSLLEEASRTVAGKLVTNAYDNFTTSYGPPTQATLSGSWTRTTQGVAPNIAPGVDDVTRFAREVLNKTVNRITRKVGTLRASSTMCQQEESVASVIDNVAGTANTRGVYRWVNKVYEASVVTYGNRLMIEFMLRRPAAPFIAEQAAQAGERLVKPVPPRRLGIRSFEDVTPQNYAQLCAGYGVTDVQPPPLAQKFATAVLRGGEDTQIAIPAGCQAMSASVACIATPTGSPLPQVLVGCQLVTPNQPATALQTSEDLTIAVSVNSTQVSLSPPYGAEFLVNVQIACAPTDRAMDEWRIGVYRALIAAYQERSEHYYGETRSGESRAPARSPLANRQIERGALKDGCLKLLLERMAMLTGGAGLVGSPPVAQVDAPRAVQFLDEALEWNEMSYSFQDGRVPGGPLSDLEQFGADSDDLFTGFLQARQARVLLPVQPARLMAFLYFFSSGMIWDGNDGMVAVNPDDVALADDLKHSGREPKACTPVGAPWEIVVPTAMQILDEATGIASGAVIVVPGAAS